MDSGIYAIRNIKTDKIYVGSAANFDRRFYLHKHHLVKGSHHSKKLQNSWNKHGETSFEWGIIEVCDPTCLIEREQYWINYFDAAKCGYNISPTAGTTYGIKGPPCPWKGKEIWDDEQRAHFAEIAKRENLPPERRKKMREAKLAENNPCYDKRWIHDSNGKHKRVNRNDIKYYIELGWFEGRLVKRDSNGNFYDGINEIESCKRDINTGRFLKKENC
jgi:group I intron endonuclease